jgi:hypothetical protein
MEKNHIVVLHRQALISYSGPNLPTSDRLSGTLQDHYAINRKCPGMFTRGVIVFQCNVLYHVAHTVRDTLPYMDHCPHNLMTSMLLTALRESTNGPKTPIALRRRDRGDAVAPRAAFLPQRLWRLLTASTPSPRTVPGSVSYEQPSQYIKLCWCSNQVIPPGKFSLRFPEWTQFFSAVYCNYGRIWRNIDGSWNDCSDVSSWILLRFRHTFCDRT